MNQKEENHEQKNENKILWNNNYIRMRRIALNDKQFWIQLNYLRSEQNNATTWICMDAITLFGMSRFKQFSTKTYTPFYFIREHSL